MIASKAKEIANKANAENKTVAADILDLLYVAISDNASQGQYNMDYSFIDIDFGVVEQVKKDLLKLGYKVSEIKTDNEFQATEFILNIDWSIEA